MAPLRLGTTLANRYRIDRLLREEGGVALYEATDTFHACLVGVKIIQRETFGDPIAFDRFKLEAWDDAAVDFGSSAGLPYFITMDWERAGPPPLPSYDPAIPIYVELDRPHPWTWMAMLLLACVMGVGGWYVGHATAHGAHTSVSQTR